MLVNSIFWKKRDSIYLVVLYTLPLQIIQSTWKIQAHYTIYNFKNLTIIPWIDQTVKLILCVASCILFHPIHSTAFFRCTLSTALGINQARRYFTTIYFSFCNHFLGTVSQHKKERLLFFIIVFIPKKGCRRNWHCTNNENNTKDEFNSLDNWWNLHVW